LPVRDKALAIVHECPADVAAGQTLRGSHRLTSVQLAHGRNRAEPKRSVTVDRYREDPPKGRPATPIVSEK